MDKVYIVYWSQTGNTLAMAEAVGKGITEAGKEAAVLGRYPAPGTDHPAAHAGRDHPH